MAQLPILNTPVLEAASDSGASNSDGVTNVLLPSISGTGGTAGATVTLFDVPAVGTPATIGTGTVLADGTWLITATTALVEGTNTITATQMVGVDPTTTSVPSPPLGVVLDTFAGPPSVALLTTDDTGASNSDGITNVALPTFVGNTGDEGSVVTLFNGATPIGTGTSDAAGNYSILATAPLTLGPNAITAVKLDVAGNTSLASDPPLNVTFDNVAPPAPSTPDLADGSDTGASNTDNITNIALPTFTGTGEEGATVTLLDGATPIGTGTVTGGIWSITATTALTAGANAITATQTDPAGNVSAASAALAVTLDTAPDTVAPAAPSVPDLADASDTGASNSDNITNVALPTFTGTGENGATVTLLDGTTPIGTGTVTAGVWSITATTALTPGVNSITATQTDPAGNVSVASAALAVTLDTVAPAAPSMPDLVDASDTGASNSDNITDVALPTFTGTGETGATVTLLDGTTPIGTGTVTGGVWSITATTALTAGANSITATQTDPAGNVSPASAALNVTLGLTPVPVPGGTTVTAVTAAPSDAVLGAAALVTLTLGLSAPVTVNTTGGTPTLTLNNGATATFVSGSGTAALVFDYTVAVGQDTPDLAVTAANLNGATVTDSAGNTPDLTGAAVNPPGTLAISSIAAFDTTTDQPVGVIANEYTGPVARIQNEYINLTPDNLNITTDTPNWFIHSGGGDDAIAVSRGTNVLDGGTGSNFLVGGRGPDTFFVDDRELTADVWSTVVGFGANDSATIWGVTPQDFGIDFADDEGADGFTGLTVHATADGLPTASLTLTGFTQADVTSGRLSVTFGTDEASGSAFMFIHANS